jgi:hypothetical protein
MEARLRVGEWEQKWREWGEEAAERLNLDTFLNLIRESDSGIPSVNEALQQRPPYAASSPFATPAHSFDLFNERHQTALFSIYDSQRVIYSESPLQPPKILPRTPVTNRIRVSKGNPHDFHVPIKVIYRSITQNHFHSTFQIYVCI